MPTPTRVTMRATNRHSSLWFAIWAMLVAYGWTGDLAHAAEVDPRRPAAIATENVPPVPPELFDQLNRYENVRTATFSGWAPDGQGMLVATRFGNSTQLHRVYEPGGRREQITFFEEPVSGRFISKATDGAMLVSMSRGGDENFQLYLLDRDQAEVTLLTDGKSRNLLGPVRDDGLQMIVESNRRNGRDTDIYLANPRRAESMEMIYQVDGQYWSVEDWSADGTRLLMNRYVSINESYPALFQVDSRSLEPLPAAAEGKVSYGSLAFAADGKSAYLTSDARGEFLQLASFDFANRQFGWLVDDLPWDVEELEVDHESGRLAFTVNEDGASALYLWEDGQRRRLDTPLGVVAGLEFSPDGQQLGFTLARPDAPADAYSLAIADGRLTRWTYSEVGGLDPRGFVSPSRIQFKSFDGRLIPAYYFRPASATKETPAPVLIQIHGGPESQYRPIFSGTSQFYLAELGIAVICPNVRGSSGYGKTYLQLDNAERREESVKDIGALLDWIAEQPELDAKRVAVIGGSYGGYMVLASLVHFGDRLRAGIDIVGIANFITFLERTSPYRQDLRRAEYGDERDAKMRAVFERINPATNAEKIRSALLVAHGTNDPRVPFFEAQQIAERVRSGLASRLPGKPQETGRDVWTVYANNEGHGFAKKDNRDYLAAVQAMFLREHLK